MAVNKIMHGGRALISAGGRPVGIITDLTWQVTYDTQDAYICGRMHPAEIAYTAQEPVSGSITAWRVVDHGVHAALGLPRLDQLLTADYTEITLFDRGMSKIIGELAQVRLLGHGEGVAARQFSQASIPFKAILFSDETAQNNDERPDRADLP